MTRTGLHGFASWVDFIKATISLGVAITFGLWAILTWAMDDRYAPKAIETNVEQNGVVAQEVKDSVRELKQVILQEQIFEIRVKSCTAASVDTRRYFSQRLNEQQTVYQNLFGMQAPVPSCSDIQ